MKSLSVLILLVLSSITYGQKVSKSERDLIGSGPNSTPMKVIKVTDSAELQILRKKSIVITNPKARLWKKLSERMLATVTNPETKGVGIAAPQIGINRQLILVQRFDKPEQTFQTMINPTILHVSDSTWFRIEGCLSIPIIREEVKRPWEVTVSFTGLDGKQYSEKIYGFTARIFLHEFDHLNGKLFTDY